MLNRRHIRLKAMQALYANTRNGNDNLRLIEKDLEKSMDKAFELFSNQLFVLTEIQQIAVQKIEDGKNKKLPNPEDLNPNTRFIDNALFRFIGEQPKIQDLIGKNSVDSDLFHKVVRKIFAEFRESDTWHKYMLGGKADFNTDKGLIIDLFTNFIAPNEELHQLYEDQNMYSVDDLPIANTALLNYLRSFKSDGYNKIPKLFKDEDDRKFGKRLLNLSILHHQEYDEMIQNQTKNWELDRIAVLDILLIKMALIEMCYFETIPIKVTINEYIELSKDFSTPKSKGFINGILDKLADRLKNEARIKKTGRGLIE